MTSEPTVYPIPPYRITVNFESDVEEYNYGQIGKAVVHVLIVPFILAFINPILSSGYVLSATFLYATVFRHKSQEYFGVLTFIILMTIFMIVA